MHASERSVRTYMHHIMQVVSGSCSCADLYLVHRKANDADIIKQITGNLAQIVHTVHGVVIEYMISAYTASIISTFDSCTEKGNEESNINIARNIAMLGVVKTMRRIEQRSVMPAVLGYS